MPCMDAQAPNVIILAGPNGAGKSTMSRRLFSQALGIPHYVNADTIARGLSAFRSDAMALKAGRVMLDHLHELADERANFAFETTLASRTFALWIAKLKLTGYLFHLFFLWVPSPEFSMNRVRERVQTGGHNIPEDTIRRRYYRGLENFFRFYQGIADSWQFFDNSNPEEPRLIAEGSSTMEKVADQDLWTQIRKGVTS